MTAQHDRDIESANKRFQSHARRAAWAGEGFMVDGPDERTDGDHARRYGHLLAAHASGRVKRPDTYDDEDEGSA